MPRLSEARLRSEDVLSAPSVQTTLPNGPGGVMEAIESEVATRRITKAQNSAEQRIKNT